VQSAWEGLARHYPDVELDAFVVMPNHVHGIVVILANDVAEANPIDLDDDRAFVGAHRSGPNGEFMNRPYRPTRKNESTRQIVMRSDIVGCWCHASSADSE